MTFGLRPALNQEDRSEATFRRERATRYLIVLGELTSGGVERHNSC